MIENSYIIVNGKYYKSDEKVLAISNRAFRYGDSVFETMYYTKGKIQNFSQHFHRINLGLQILKMSCPLSFNEDNISSEIHKLLIKNKIFNAGRIRLSIFRQDGGYFVPETNNIDYCIETTKLENELYTLNQKGLLIDIYSEQVKHKSFLSRIKHGNALIYVLAGIYAKENRFDDCLLLNENNHLIESVSSNLFIVKNQTIYTPSIEEGCLPGIMREKVIDCAQELNFVVFDECALTENDLLQADEIFLTNSITGIKWVVAFKNRRYYNKVSKKLTEYLNSKL
jgi:aminodeoxychorismate lyase